MADATTESRFTARRRKAQEPSRIGKVADSVVNTFDNTVGIVEDGTGTVRKVFQVANAAMDPVLFDQRAEAASVLTEAVQELVSMGWEAEKAARYLTTGRM